MWGKITKITYSDQVQLLQSNNLLLKKKKKEKYIFT